MSNIGLGIFGTPAGFDSEFVGCAKELSASENWYPATEFIPARQNEQTWRIRRLELNGDVFSTYALYRHALPVQTNRQSTFVGACVVLKNVDTVADVALELLYEMAGALETHLTDERRFKGALSAIWLRFPRIRELGGGNDFLDIPKFNASQEIAVCLDATFNIHGLINASTRSTRLMGSGCIWASESESACSRFSKSGVHVISGESTLEAIVRDEERTLGSLHEKNEKAKRLLDDNRKELTQQENKLANLKVQNAAAEREWHAIDAKIRKDEQELKNFERAKQYRQTLYDEIRELEAEKHELQEQIDKLGGYRKKAPDRRRNWEPARASFGVRAVWDRVFSASRSSEAHRDPPQRPWLDMVFVVLIVLIGVALTYVLLFKDPESARGSYIFGERPYPPTYSYPSNSRLLTSPPMARDIMEPVPTDDHELTYEPSQTRSVPPAPSEPTIPRD